MVIGQPKVLAIASSGGHFVQLLRLMPAFEGCNVTIASTDPAQCAQVHNQATRLGMPLPVFCVVTEANRWQKLKLIQSLFDVARLVFTLRPDVVITTGAAPGYFALRLGHLAGTRTVWLDSIANAEELSLSGQKVARHADLWLTQWAHLAREGGPEYKGAVL